MMLYSALSSSPDQAPIFFGESPTARFFGEGVTDDRGLPLLLGVVADLESVTGMAADLPVLLELAGVGGVDGGVGEVDSSRLMGMAVVFNCG
jgi:hypothetical protein